MKKNKDYLTISSIIMLIYIIYFFLHSISNDKFITNNMFLSICNVVEVVLGLFGSLYLLNISNSTSDLKRYENKILFFAIVFFISNIVSGILLFIVYNSIKDKVKKELPKLDDIKQNNFLSLLSLGICLFLLFYVNNKVDKIIYNLLIYLAILFIMIFNYRKRIIRDFKYFKDNFKNYFKYSLKIWGLSLLTLMFISIFITITTGMTNATNQQDLNEAMKQYPILISFLTILYAPIAEELMFRGVFKDFIKNKVLFIIISGFVFGLLHVIDDYTSVKELLFVFIYASMGCYLAYIYQKTNNIFSNITFHFLQNTFATIIMLIMTYLV